MPTSPATSDRPRVLPTRGNFAGQSVVGPFEPDAASMNSDEPLFGMPPEALYLWGTLRDDAGDLHTIMRRIPHREPATSRRSLIVQSTVGGAAQLRMPPCGKNSAQHVDVIRELVGADAIQWRSHPDAKGGAFHAQWRPDGCTWVEEGVFELEGKI